MNARKFGGQITRGRILATLSQITLALSALGSSSLGSVFIINEYCCHWTSISIISTFASF